MQLLGAAAGGAGAGAASGGALANVAGAAALATANDAKKQQHPVTPEAMAGQQAPPSMTQDYLGFLSQGRRPNQQNKDQSLLLKLLDFGANGF